MASKKYWTKVQLRLFHVPIHCEIAEPGVYTRDGTTLTLGPLASTKKACPPAIMDQEAKFHQALGETRGYRFENGRLFLLDAQGAAVMRLWRRD